MLQSFLIFLNTSGFMHNALLAPLFLILADFATGISSALKNKQFQFSSVADILGPESDLIKYAVGAIALFVANGLHIFGPDLNAFFGTGGSLVLDVATLASVLNNLIELLPAAWQPEAKAIEGDLLTAVQHDLAAGGGGGQQSAAPGASAPIASAQQHAASVAALSAPHQQAQAQAQSFDGQPTAVGIPATSAVFAAGGGLSADQTQRVNVVPTTNIQQQQQQTPFFMPSGL